MWSVTPISFSFLSNHTDKSDHQVLLYKEICRGWHCKYFKRTRNETVSRQYVFRSSHYQHTSSKEAPHSTFHYRNEHKTKHKKKKKKIPHANNFLAQSFQTFLFQFTALTIRLCPVWVSLLSAFGPLPASFHHHSNEENKRGDIRRLGLGRILWSGWKSGSELGMNSRSQFF